jgi:hypothetical protein
MFAAPLLFVIVFMLFLVIGKKKRSTRHSANGFGLRLLQRDKPAG